MAIVIIVANVFNIIALCVNRQKFGRTLKILKNYGKVRPRFIFPISCAIGHHCPESCEQKPANAAYVPDYIRLININMESVIAI